MRQRKALSPGNCVTQTGNDNWIRKSGKPGLNSRGSSLIEVIVAMLVLAIIIVPMLDMFSSAARTNARSREKQYANSVLENVLEEISAGNFTFSYGETDAANAPLRDFGSRLQLYSTQTEDAVLSGKQFVTSVMTQGMSEYQAVLSFDATSYREGGSGLNDYQMPQINSYDTSNCEMVLLDAAGDGPVVDEFYRQYLAQSAEEYQQRLNSAWMSSESYLFQYEFERWYANWKQAHSDDPDAEPPADYTPAPFDSSSVRASSPVDKDTFQSYVQKNTVIHITDAGLGEYSVGYTVCYAVNASATELNLDYPFYETYEYSAGSGSRYTAENLKYIYVFYQPFSPGLAKETLLLNAEMISRESDWDCILYLAVQGGASAGTLKFDVTMYPGLTAEECSKRLRILSAGDLQSDFGYEPELVPTQAAADRVYRVTVRIVEAGTDETVAEAATTLYYE